MNISYELLPALLDSGKLEIVQEGDTLIGKHHVYDRDTGDPVTEDIEILQGVELQQVITATENQLAALRRLASDQDKFSLTNSTNEDIL
jgi:hypothetical protein